MAQGHIFSGEKNKRLGQLKYGTHTMPENSLVGIVCYLKNRNVEYGYANG
jgi:hypothetical protein